VDKLKMIFLVTRKTGCTTMINALNETYNVDMNYWPASFGASLAGGGRIMTNFLADQAKDHYVFVVSRDPLTRFYSGVHQVRASVRAQR
jgi:hypothetical protein